MLLVISVVIDMASVGVRSHQGRAYGAQPEPLQLLHSSGAAGLLSRPLDPRHGAFSGLDASGRWRRLVWVELGVWLGFKAHGIGRKFCSNIEITLEGCNTFVVVSFW